MLMAVLNSTTSWENFYKANLTVTYGLAITPLGIYSQEIKLYFDKKTCTKMFTTALFIIVPN